MNPGLKKLLAISLVAPGCLALGLFEREGRGDEPGPLGRLFRLGDRPAPVSSPSHANPRPSTNPHAGPPTHQPPTPAPSIPTPSLSGPGATSSPISTYSPAPSAPEAGPSSRIVPQPRVSRAATESDPILTRVAIGRSDDGNRFGMFLQVFADGTVMDGEGIHQVGREAIRPVLEAIESSQALQAKGHCGGPPTDFVEQVHIVVYERSFGRLRANAFSFSGNPQGCDPGVRQLQTALDALQARLSGMPAPASTSAGMLPSTVGTSAFATDAAPPPPTASGGRVIPLTPLN